MSVPLEGKRGGRKDVSLNGHGSHLPPQHSSNSQILPTCSPLPADKSFEVTCRSETEVEYLDIFTRNEEEEDDGNISEWSEEDLSLHFSPSVILQSDSEESESGLECGNGETQVEREKEPKKVPKQQILLRGKDKENLIDQVMMKDEPSEMGGFTEGHYNPHSILRQNSMPASLHMHPTPSGETDSYRVYKGHIAGANKGPLVERSWRCLKKSNSLDETKTKMASSLIMNILSKKMQVEHRGDTGNTLKKKHETLPVPTPPAEQQGAKNKEETGEFKTPLHLVRDVRSFIKHNNSKYFNMKTTSCNVIDREESIPHLPAVEGKHHVAMVTASVSKSQNRKQDYSGSCLTKNEYKNNEPITDSDNGDDVTFSGKSLDTPTVKNDPSGLSQSERAVVSLSPWQSSQPCLQKQMSSESGPEHPHQPQPCVYASTPCDSSQFAPIQHLHPYFYKVHPHLRSVRFIYPPLSCVPSHLQHPSLPSTHHLLSSTVKKKGKLRESSSNVLDRTETTGDQDHRRFGRTESQDQQLPPQIQQPFPWSLQPFIPAQVGSDFVFTAATGALLSIPSSCHLMLDPNSQHCFYMNTPPAPQRKMLLDPETGQFVQVLLPAHSVRSTSNTPVLPLNYGNPSPSMVHMQGNNPTVLPMVQFPSLMGVPLLYGTPCLAVTMITSALQTRDDVTHHAPR